LGRFLYATIWTILSAAGGHFESAIDGQYPSAQAIANGTDIRTIAGRVGHANSSTTMNVYAHFLKSSNAKASEQLNSGLFASKVTKL